MSDAFTARARVLRKDVENPKVAPAVPPKAWNRGCVWGRALVSIVFEKEKLVDIDQSKEAA